MSCALNQSLATISTNDHPRRDSGDRIKLPRKKRKLSPPLSSGKRFHFARFQADRTKVGNLNAPIRLAKNVARRDQPVGVHKPNAERNLGNVRETTARRVQLHRFEFWPGARIHG
jgi:hypothetical protein